MSIEQAVARVRAVVGVVGVGILVLLAVARTAGAVAVDPIDVDMPITMREFGGLNIVLVVVALGTAVGCVVAWHRGWSSWRVLPVLLLPVALLYGWWLFQLWLDLSSVGPVGGQVPLRWTSSWGIALGAAVVLAGRTRQAASPADGSS